MLGQSVKLLWWQKLIPQGATRKWLTFALRLGVTLLLFFVLLRSFDWSHLLQTLMSVDIAILLIGMIVGFFGIILSCYQWKSLLDGENINVGLSKLVNFYFIGIAFNHFLPTGMGGDVIKAYYVNREGGSTAASASAVLMARITGLFGMFIVSIAALIIWHASIPQELVRPFLLMVLAACGAIAFAMLSVTYLPKIFKSKWVKHPLLAPVFKIGNAFSTTFRRPRSMSSATLFGVLFHIETCLNYYIYAEALHLNVQFPYYLVAIPFVTLVAFLPVSINGFGLRESIFVYVFSIIHVPVATSVLLVLLVDLQTLLFGVMGGAIYLAMGSSKPTTGKSAGASSSLRTLPTPHAGGTANPVLASSSGDVKGSRYNEVRMDKHDEIPSGNDKQPGSEAAAMNGHAKGQENGARTGTLSPDQIEKLDTMQVVATVPQEKKSTTGTLPNDQEKKAETAPSENGQSDVGVQPGVGAQSKTSPSQPGIGAPFTNPSEAPINPLPEEEKFVAGSMVSDMETTAQTIAIRSTSKIGGKRPERELAGVGSSSNTGKPSNVGSPSSVGAPFTSPSTGRDGFSNSMPGRIMAPPEPPKPPARKSRGGVFVGILLVAMIVLGSGFFAMKLGVFKGPPEVGAYRVAAKQSVNLFSGGGGIVYPRQQWSVSFANSQRALDVYVSAGNQVKRGQPLMRIDASQLNAQLTQASNDVAVKKQYLDTVTAQGNPATIAAATQDYQLALNNYNALSASASPDGKILSPMAGVVTDVNVFPNQVSPANTSLITVMDQSSVVVHAKIPLTNLGQVRVGLPATVTPSATPGVTFQGTVTAVVPVSDPQTDTFEAQITVKNPQQTILPGMSAFVNIQGKVQGYVIPRAAVLNDNTIFLITDEHAYMQKVNVVGRTVDKYVIDTGVAPGQTIVVVGMDQLHDGQQVKVSSVQN